MCGLIQVVRVCAVSSGVHAMGKRGAGMTGGRPSFSTPVKKAVAQEPQRDPEALSDPPSAEEEDGEEVSVPSSAVVSKGVGVVKRWS